MTRKLFMAAACLLIGCRDSTAPSTITVTTTTSAESMPVAGTLSITTVVTNNGTETVQLTSASCPSRPFEVLTAFGVVVGPRQPEICALDIRAPEPIAPGETLTFTTTWNGESSQVGPADESVYLTAGIYVIRSRVLVTGEDAVYGNRVPIKIQ